MYRKPFDIFNGRVGSLLRHKRTSTLQTKLIKLFSTLRLFSSCFVSANPSFELRIKFHRPKNAINPRLTLRKLIVVSFRETGMNLYIIIRIARQVRIFFISIRNGYFRVMSMVGKVLPRRTASLVRSITSVLAAQL